MSITKLPGIKGLVSGSQSKRRFKSELSVDMISPPLGDFRHTMHVGRGGDVFGDTSFLSNHGGNGGTSRGGAGSPESPTGSTKAAGFLSRTLRHVRKSPPSRTRTGSRDLSQPPPPVSPIIKNAISLPQLNVDMGNGCAPRTLLPNSLSSPHDSLFSYGLQSGFVTLPRLSRLDKQSQDPYAAMSPDFMDHGGLTRSDSMTSFTVDLGPSLMSEVLGVIDSPSANSSGSGFCFSNPLLNDGHKRVDDDDEDSSLVGSVMESPMRNLLTNGSTMDHSPCNGRKGRPPTPGWATPTHIGSSSSHSDTSASATPDASMWSPVREEPAIEAGRFRQAVDVLARHYGGGSQVQGQRRRSDDSEQQMELEDREQYDSPALKHCRHSCSSQDEEDDEIKV